jgi:hypothetical protein
VKAVKQSATAVQSQQEALAREMGVTVEQLREAAAVLGN